MPQLDFIHYPSQIFWFVLCFIALYLSAHFVILPRIRAIISRRHDLIESDKSLAEEIEKQIELVNNEAQENLQKANREYLKKIEEITKESQKFFFIYSFNTIANTLRLDFSKENDLLSIFLFLTEF